MHDMDRIWEQCNIFLHPCGKYKIHPCCTNLLVWISVAFCKEARYCFKRSHVLENIAFLDCFMYKMYMFLWVHTHNSRKNLSLLSSNILFTSYEVTNSIANFTITKAKRHIGTIFPPTPLFINRHIAKLSLYISCILMSRLQIMDTR